MNCANEFPRVLDGGIGMNSVTEVENMALALSEFLENGFYLLTDASRRRIQNRRVEIPLKRHPVPDQLPGAADINGPIQAHDLASGGGDGIDRMPAVFTENDDRRSLRPDPGDGLLDVPQRKFAEGVPGEDSAPGVKDLNCLSP